MQLFTTYYENVPITFISSKEDQLRVHELLKNEKLKQFFQNEKIKIFVSSQQINDIRHINKHLEFVNKNLNMGEYYFGHFETFTSKKNRTWVNNIAVLSSIYFFLVYIIHGVFPKIKYFNKIYFFFTKGKDRLLSKAEVLGRLIAFGFEIDIFKNIDGICYFRVKKNKEITSKIRSSYGLIFKMKRVGKNGKLFYIYKFRTMHPYSEYLQDYIVHKHGLNEKGKIKRDFRLTPWGKWMRRYWLDEIPQLFNVLKGQMKLVGVRPVSESYFNRLPMDLKISRTKFKPGCIPPYVALNFRPSFKDVLFAERIYIKMKTKNPYTTDIKLFFLALINIIFRGKRSS